MDIDIIIPAFKERTVSTFDQRVAGAAEFKALPEKSNLVTPAAYVIDMDDDAGPQDSENGYSQIIKDSFAVVVVLSNVPDERGQTAVVTVNQLRRVLFAALLGWRPTEEYGPIIYEGGQLLHMDRARLYYQFEFSASTEITEADTWQGVSNAALPAFGSVDIKVDPIDPHDPNLGSSGPDGKIDAEILIQVP